jgi:hypothetical protein
VLLLLGVGPGYAAEGLAGTGPKGGPGVGQSTWPRRLPLRREALVAERTMWPPPTSPPTPPQSWPGPTGSLRLPPGSWRSCGPGGRASAGEAGPWRPGAVRYRSAPLRQTHPPTRVRLRALSRAGARPRGPHPGARAKAPHQRVTSRPQGTGAQRVSSLGVTKAAHVLAALKRDGWVEERRSGSHRVLAKGGRTRVWAYHDDVVEDQVGTGQGGEGLRLRALPVAGALS